MSKYQIRHAKKSDIPKLKNIFDSWENYEKITGQTREEDYFEKCLDEGDLPPIQDASKDNYHLKVVLYEGEIIGFYDQYYGYPNKESVWMSLFVIDKNIRGNGHGKDILKRIEKDLWSTDYKELSIGVDLKNHAGLMFWTKSGFDQVIGVYGDKEYSSKHYAMIALKKRKNI